MNRLKKTIQISLTAAALFMLSPFTAHAQWIQDSSGWKYMQDGTSALDNWLFINGAWYHFNESGYMDTGWITSNGSSYYLDDSGAMATGTLILEGSYYSFSPTGEFLGGPVPVHIEGLDDTMLADGIRQTDKYWSEINYILGLVNQERERVGAAPLVLDKDLCNIAGYRCAYMDVTGYYEHDIDGYSLGNATASAYLRKGMDLGENLYCYRSLDGSSIPYSIQESAERGINWYLKSPAHYENMIYPSYKKIGLGIYSNKDNSRRFLTQIFQQ